MGTNIERSVRDEDKWSYFDLGVLWGAQTGWVKFKEEVEKYYLQNSHVKYGLWIQKLCTQFLFLLFKSFLQEIKNQIRIINTEVQEPEF